jgi:hypothetical protein
MLLDINRDFGAKEGGEDDVRQSIFAALHPLRVEDNAIHPIINTSRLFRAIFPSLVRQSQVPS